MGYYAQMLANAGTESSIASCPVAAMKEAIENGHGDAMVPIMLDLYLSKFDSGS